MNNPTSSKVIGIDRYRTTTQNDGESLDITQLALKLQQTIEITPLLQTFCHQTADIIPCDSVKFEHENNLLNYQTGQQKNHMCSYQLELEGEVLGKIACSRSTPFTLRETDLMERLLSLLIYPLRNALLYQKAVAEAHRDPLTGISNRAAFDQALNRETCSFKRHLTGFSLMVIDIDHFKLVNDTYGHIAGDNVLHAIAQTIKSTLRRSDEVFRYGGEEFVVLLSNTELGGAKFIAERIRKAIKGLRFTSNNKIKVTASIGISSTNNIRDVNDTLFHADKALYQAKDNGRNQVAVRP